MTEAIVLDGAGKAYGGQAVLAPTTLSIATGRFVALVGGSGAGKTTLLKLMNGLSAPTTGRVLVEGVDVAPQLGSRPRGSTNCSIWWPCRARWPAGRRRNCRAASASGSAWPGPWRRGPRSC